ncbi:hypothetical protein E2C01_028014 [Portunus trituberculatus]|uniref:Uncharacterized protein n=1 Tax=Portunus trituberculatus TaxID=210409 RepID=A0A5B7EJF5_PORTR|nr:hypothetical protein [Portunus trituberculatus]
MRGPSSAEARWTLDNASLTPRPNIGASTSPLRRFPGLGSVSLRRFVHVPFFYSPIPLLVFPPDSRPSPSLTKLR